MYQGFDSHIAAMNRTYTLDPIVINDVHAVNLRLQQFDDILGKEFAELHDIQMEAVGALGSADLLRVRVGLADLLGDIIVYCASEAQRWDIPLDQVMTVIMSSNFSKLGADGKPILNPENGKFEKGPNYWKPEPIISKILTGELRIDTESIVQKAGAPHDYSSLLVVTQDSPALTAPAGSDSPAAESHP